MFFIMGITDGRKDFDFTQTIICNLCGKYGRYQVFMTYTVLSLFSYLVSNGISIIMCRRAVVALYTNLIRKLENRLREVSRWRFCHNICLRCVRVAVGIDTNAVHSAGMRRQKILNSVRSVENDFRRIKESMENSKNQC